MLSRLRPLISRLPARIAISSAVLFAALSAPRANADTAAELKSKYKPSRPPLQGSVFLESYRRSLSSFFWQNEASSPVVESAKKFLSTKLFAGEGENQILVLDPGARIPDLPPLSPKEIDAVSSDPVLFSQIASRVLPPGEWTSSSPLEGFLPQSVFTKLSADRELVDLLAAWSRRSDFIPSVLGTLCALRESVSDAEWSKYKKAALAIALVDDQLKPPNMPHSQVNPSLLPGPPMTPLEKFRDLVSAHKAGNLLTDITKLSVGELCFLVGHSLSASELAWARANRPACRPDELARKSFMSVRYSDSRVQRKEYVWENHPYTLENIAREGGICIDQAYYADALCKASGIPSMVFTGTGDAGGHAWVGFLTSSGVWDCGIGRDGSSYLNGRTLNPQTWAAETDHDFVFATSEQSLPSKLEALLASVFMTLGDTPKAVAAASSAAALAPGDAAIWSEKLRLISENLPPSQLSASIRDALRGKDITPAVRAMLKAGLARVERSQGRDFVASKMEKSIVEENFKTRSDISSQQIAEKIKSLMDRGETGKAMLEYRGTVRSIPPGASGDFFYSVTRPFVTLLAERGERAQAIQAAKIARQKMNPPKGSLLDLDLRDLESAAMRSGAPRQSRQRGGVSSRE